MHSLGYGLVTCLAWGALLPGAALAKPRIDDGVIAYSVKTGIYAVHPGGGPSRVLVPWHTRNCGSQCVIWSVPRHPRFSPNGKLLTYEIEPNKVRRGVGAVQANARTVWVAHADGSHRRRLGAGHDPTFSPDGKEVIYMTNPDTWPKTPIDVEPTDPFNDGYGPMRAVTLSTSTTRAVPAPGATEFSRDGRHMVFVHEVKNADGYHSVLTISNLDGTQPQSIPAPAHFYAEPVRFVTGGRISYNCPGPRRNQPDICLLDPSTRHIRRLVHTEDFWELFAVSSPTGTRFAVSGLHGLYVTDRHGHHAHTLVRNGSGPDYVQSDVPYDPDWQPRS